MGQSSPLLAININASLAITQSGKEEGLFRELKSYRSLGDKTARRACPLGVIVSAVRMKETLIRPRRTRFP